MAAAGNDGEDNDASPFYPASYNLASIISVGASDQDDVKAWFSNYGKSSVHLFAPGVQIYSSVLGTSYAFYSGTSMACPHVAGAAALLWSYRPNLTAASLKSLLMNNVDSVPGLAGKCATGVSGTETCNQNHPYRSSVQACVGWSCTVMCYVAVLCMAHVLRQKLLCNVLCGCTLYDTHAYMTHRLKMIGSHFTPDCRHK